MVKLSSVYWMKEAACKDETPRLFHSFDLGEMTKAKAVCDTCLVRLPCLLSFWDMATVSASTTKYERLLQIWKRVDRVDDSNWREPDIIFENESRGKR